MLGVVSIFTYELESADETFASAGADVQKLNDFGALTEAANESGAISQESISDLVDWHRKLKAGLLK